MTYRSLTLVVLALWLCSTPSTSAEPNGTAIAINGRVPLGIESFRLDPGKTDFYLMASAEDGAFASMMRVIHAGRSSLVANGKRIRFYPEQVVFRLTASSREKLLDDHPFPTAQTVGLEDLFIQLKFRMKVFHGLEYRYLQPEFVENIGMPADIPYNERIYRIGFNLGKIPIEDRVVMEVLSPSGDRLCKFHLDLL